MESAIHIVCTLPSIVRLITWCEGILKCEQRVCTASGDMEIPCSFLTPALRLAAQTQQEVLWGAVCAKIVNSAMFINIKCQPTFINVDDIYKCQE